MSYIKYWLWLSSLAGLRPKTKSDLYEYFENPEEIYFANKSEYMMIGGISEQEIKLLLDKSLDSSKRIMDYCAQNSISFITVQDAAFPQRLKNIYDPPALLYVKGRLPVMDEEAAIAIIGTRAATPYGIKMGRKIGCEISKCGGLVVSGLTAGIDTAGAQGALLAGGSCIGILGTAINDVYPSSNRSLFEDVASVGALISEYPPNTKAVRSNFRERNRLISGISAGVTVIEAPEKSGALMTAACALEQGRDLFAVPGNADSKSCEGSNELLKECAKMVTCGWDILCEYETQYHDKIKRMSFQTEPGSNESAFEDNKSEAQKFRPDKTMPAPDTESGFEKLRSPSLKKLIGNKKNGEYIDIKMQLEGLSESQLKIVSVMSVPHMHIDDIIDLSQLPASTVLSDLTMMQISGFVCQEKGKRFSLNINTKRG